LAQTPQLKATYSAFKGDPRFRMIGPDGKIIAKDLRGENIKATVERTLAKAGPAS
jgi:hypothetical protein